MRHIQAKSIILAALLCAAGAASGAASPVERLLERIDAGASRKFVIEQVAADTDFFELDQRGEKVVVRGNNPVSIATGVNWYLKYHAGIHLSWNGMKARLPEVLPPVARRERHETALDRRYALNFCTFSYSMAFWDWERWEQELDWMALHGVNLSLALTGTEPVWRAVLLRLGYSREEADSFVAGPAFTAWWLMNNLEGWGGPDPESWYKRQEELQKKILRRMRELGIRPVLPGYCGMVPHDARERLGLDVADPGTWCGYRRPAFLQPEDARFQEIAALYYRELERLYGRADYYAIDPFHEGGNTQGVDLAAAGRAILDALRRGAGKQAVWVAQAWQRNPRPQMTDALPAGSLLVLDLHAECRPQWGDPASEWRRPDGFGPHDWIYCMLLNFGGNVGLHGCMTSLIDGFQAARADARAGRTLRGTGLTPEGIENNPVMYELAMELPWREERFTKEEWLDGYVRARYGTAADDTLRRAWTLLANGIYDCPRDSVQQGTTESVFCARPSLDVRQASSWAETKDYYRPADVVEAARLMLAAAGRHAGGNNYEYDLVDIVRQAVAEKGRLVLRAAAAAWRAGERDLFGQASRRFLRLIELQDELLGTRREFRLGRWTDFARAAGGTPEEKALYEWNARVQITTWGDRDAADRGGLRDYAHKEWNGILRDLYAARWRAYFDCLSSRLRGEPCADPDFYAMEEAWTRAPLTYSAEPEGDPVEVARRVFAEVFPE